MKFGLRELFFFAVLLAVPLAAWFFLFKPRNDDITKAKAEIEIKQTNLKKLAEVTSKISDIGLAIEQGRESIALIEAKLPSEQSVDLILEQVWSLAKKNRLTVMSVKSEKAVPAALYMELPLKMQMEGQFDGFYQFMLELENLPRITRIYQLKLERAGSALTPSKKGEVNEELPPGSMTTEFILSIYFEPQNRDNMPAPAAPTKSKS